MIRLNKILFVLSMLLYFTGSGQDLFDYNNTKKFAKHLMLKGAYRMALPELERLCYLKNEESDKLKLLQCYLYSGNYSLGIKRARALFNFKEPLEKGTAKTFGQLLLLDKKHDDASFYFKSIASENLENKSGVRAINEMMQANWNRADSIIGASGNPDESLQSIIVKATNQKYKKIGVSLGLSMIVPGSGKMYAGYWTDGIISLLLTGVMAYQAYRGFGLNGKKSVYGWVYVGLSGGFYLGNLYGTVKATKRRNQQIKQKLIDEVEAEFYSNL